MGSKGDAKMRFEMALSFLEGESVNKTMADAWLRKAYLIAKTDDVAYFAGRVAELLRSEKSVVEPWVRECVEKLYAQLDEDSTGRAMAALMALSNSNCAWAIYLVGDAYYSGDGGLEEDKAEAFKWFVRAADLALPDALVAVGMVYQGELEGAEVNEEKAREYYSKAFNVYLDKAEHGDTYSQRTLGDAYKYGEDIVNNEVNQQKAFEWYLKAAINGDSDAMEGVSDCYRDGEGVTQDKCKALEWYVKAAENGAKGPISVLTRNYYLGKKVCGIELAREYDKAIHFAKLGVGLYNSPSCLAFLGRCYYHGNGIGEDNDAAFKCFKEAAELGDAMAQDYLGDCYKGGYGVEENIGEAKKWYRIAAENGSESAKESLKKLEESESSGW